MTYEDYEPVRWEPANFVVPAAALAADIEGVATTLIDKGDGFVCAWSIKLMGDATLPDAETTIKAISAGIREYLRTAFPGIEHQADDGT